MHGLGRLTLASISPASRTVLRITRPARARGSSRLRGSAASRAVPPDGLGGDSPG